MLGSTATYTVQGGVILSHTGMQCETVLPHKTVPCGAVMLRVLKNQIGLNQNFAYVLQK